MASEESVSTVLEAHLAPEARSWQGRLKAASARLRYQLLAAFVIAILLPAVVHYAMNSGIGRSIEYRNSFLGSCAAVLLTFLVIRKVSAFPGVKATAYVLPTVLGAFGLVVGFFFFLRIHYSGTQLFVSFFLTVSLYYVLLELARGGRKPVMDLLMTGAGSSLLPKIGRAHV